MIINKELLNFIPRPETNSYELLKQDIAENGIRQPIVFAEINGQNVVVDGHTRYQIAEELGITDYPTKKLALNSLEDAKHYMLITQLSRRNLDKKSFTLFLGELYEMRKNKQGGTGANRYTAKLRIGLDDLFPTPDKYTKLQETYIDDVIDNAYERNEYKQLIIRIVCNPWRDYVTEETKLPQTTVENVVDRLSDTELALIRSLPYEKYRDAINRLRISFEQQDNLQNIQSEYSVKSTEEQIADEFGVSKSTIYRAAKQVRELNKLDKAQPGLKAELIKEKASAKKISELAKELDEAVPGSGLKAQDSTNWDLSSLGQEGTSFILY